MWRLIKLKLQLEFVGFGVYAEISMAIKNKVKLYTDVDWIKAATLFKNSQAVPLKKANISAINILLTLARFADNGIKFMANADNPAIVEYALFGTGPLNWETRRIIKRFKKQKFAEVQESEDGTITVKIAKKGMTRALSYKLDTLQLSKTKNWDGKWRVVIFDIPDVHRRFRDLFRKRLVQLGLYQLQESVYVSPYSCFDEIEFLRELYGIAFTVRYLLAERIEEDAFLRNYFSLSH